MGSRPMGSDRDRPRLTRLHERTNCNEQPIEFEVLIALTYLPNGTGTRVCVSLPAMAPVLSKK